VIDVRKGNVISDKPVWVKMLNGFLNAQRLDIGDNGSVVRFSGVAMTLQPGKETAGQTADEPASPAAKPSSQ
jgi:lipopolysaccharide export system protein LptC